MAALRAERAGLFGFDSHADYVLDDQTAGTVEAVDRVLSGMVPVAAANARAEAAELEELLHADGHDGPLQPWDHAYYSAQVRSRRFSVGGDDLRPYLELEHVLHGGVLAAATRLYGTTFTERSDLPGYHPDVRVFEVHDEDGSGLGLFVCDWFARPTKRGGAWMTTFVDQSDLLGDRPVVTVCLNVPRPPEGRPALLTPDEVDTAFHEFGHALHGLFSAVRHPRFSGTSVPRDYVEFPSQVNEMWAWHPEVLPGWAVHHETGEPLPQPLLEALKQALAYGEGFRTTEYLAATLLDLAWHALPPGRQVAPEDVEAFEAEVLAGQGLDVPSVPPRYRSTYFSHVFAGGYSAGYYGYIWSEVLDAELVDWFTENGGLRRELGDTFRRELLSRGGSADPMEMFRAVRGRAPSPEPLLRRRGLLVGGSS